MQNNWLVKNLVNNFIIIFAYLFLGFAEISPLFSLVFAYFFATIIGLVLFPIPKHIEAKLNSHPEFSEFSETSLWIGIVIISIVSGVVVYYFWHLIVDMGYDENQTIVWVILTYNLLGSMVDNHIKKAVEEELS